MKRLLKLMVGALLFTSCEKTMVKQDDFVTLHQNDLLGRYVINYDVFASMYYNNLPNSLKNYTDTFELKLSSDKSRMEWRSLSANKAFQFEAEVKYLPIEIKGYKLAKIPFFIDRVKYVGSYDTITAGKNWNLYAINDLDEYAYFILKDGKIRLEGTDLVNDLTKAHLKTSSGKMDSNEWRLKFRIKSCVKIE